MRIALTAASTIAGFVWAAGLFAQGPNGSELTVTGQLLSTGDMSLVVKADDGRESPPLIVTTTTRLPPGLAAGNRVTVYYHPVGDREVADRVVPVAASAPPAPTETRSAPDRLSSGQGGPLADPADHETDPRP